jgi:hypothetical protein
VGGQGYEGENEEEEEEEVEDRGIHIVRTYNNDRINGKIQIFNFVTPLLRALPVCLSLLVGWGGNLSRWRLFTIHFQGSGPAWVAF